VASAGSPAAPAAPAASTDTNDYYYFLVVGVLQEVRFEAAKFQFSILNFILLMLIVCRKNPSNGSRSTEAFHTRSTNPYHYSG
jgi:hypothetical protein